MLIPNSGGLGLGAHSQLSGRGLRCSFPTLWGEGSGAYLQFSGGEAQVLIPNLLEGGLRCSFPTLSTPTILLYLRVCFNSSAAVYSALHVSIQAGDQMVYKLVSVLLREGFSIEGGTRRLIAAHFGFYSCLLCVLLAFLFFVCAHKIIQTKHVNLLVLPYSTSGMFSSTLLSGFATFT